MYVKIWFQLYIFKVAGKKINCDDDIPETASDAFPHLNDTDSLAL